MYFRISWDTDFDTLMMHLWSKYGKELFTLDGIGEQMDLNKFSKNFFNSNGPSADVSVDANANVVAKTGIEYNFELPKPLKRYNSYFLLWKELKKAYGLETANDIIESQLTGDIYINDFTDIASPYCFNYSTNDIAFNGLDSISKRIRVFPPKSLDTFLRQVEQFVVVAANSTLGATGFADLLLVASRYVDNLLETGMDGHTEIGNPETYIKERLTAFVYTVNWEFRGNQCVTEDTEVLTPSGFKSLDELKVGEKIYTWKDGKLNVNDVQRVNVYDYDGEMHVYSGRDIMQVVTPNHRVLYSLGKRKNVLDESSKLIDLKTPITIPVALENDREDYAISDDELDGVAFFLTDGSIESGTDGRSDRIIWCKSENRWGADEFKRIMEAAGCSPYERIQKSGLNGSDVHVWRLHVEESKRWIELLNGTKKKLPEWMYSLSKRQAKRVLDIWSKTDGMIDGSKIHLQADNWDIADGLQHLAMLAGYGSRSYEERIGKNKNATIYVSLYQRKSKDATSKERIHYKGRVWCPTTEDGIVIFRKDGKVFISGNSPFTNISLYDDTFLDSLCPDYNATKETVKMLQRIYVDVMNEELSRSPITFPVTTACFCKESDGTIKDKEFLDFIANANLKFGWINIYNGDTSTLSSCCRLRSNKDNPYFNSFGAGSTKIGSLGVVTANLPRIAYKAKGDFGKFLEDLEEIYIKTAKINACKRRLVRKRIELGAAPLYTQGYMDLNRQYSTFGIVGINEAVQLLGKDILSKEGQEMVVQILESINQWIDRAEAQYKAPHNVEQVPAETSAIKLASKDKMLGYDIGVPLYSNQFIPLIVKADMLDRLKLQGMFDSKLSGGAIAHINVGEQIKDPKVMVSLMEYAAKCGVVYWAINYLLECCPEKHLWVGGEICPVCGRKSVNKMTRVVGFLTSISNWHPVRRTFDFPQRQFYKDEVKKQAEKAKTA